MVRWIVLKRIAKKSAGWVSAFILPFTPSTHHPKACIFVYHRVTEIEFIDPYVDDWNVAPIRFEEHIAALSDFADIVPLLDLPDHLAKAGSSKKPIVCLTFDDAYLNFYTQALPILKRYSAPATVFVVTNFIGNTEPAPWDKWGQINRSRIPAEAYQLMAWEKLEACLASGLVTIGAHSHRHLNARHCTAAQLIEEAEQSHDVLSRRIGAKQVQAYAYPFGSSRLGHVTLKYIAAVKEAGYVMAVSTNLGLATSKSNKYLLPRIEAHALDTPPILRAKALGALAPYFFLDRLRNPER